jgi:hypothetical protein
LERKLNIKILKTLSTVIRKFVPKAATVFVQLIFLLIGGFITLQSIYSRKQPILTKLIGGFSPAAGHLSLDATLDAV